MFGHLFIFLNFEFVFFFKWKKPKPYHTAKVRPTPALHHSNPKHAAVKLPKISHNAQWGNYIPFSHSFFSPHKPACSLSVPSCSQASCTGGMAGPMARFWACGLPCSQQLGMQPSTGGTTGLCLPAGKGRGGLSFADKDVSREEKRERRHPLQGGRERKNLRARGSFGRK